MIDETTFARRSLRAYTLYEALLEHERAPEFQRILRDLAGTSREQFDFWARKSGVRGDDALLPVGEVTLFRLMRFFLGLKLTLKFLLGRKEHVVATYRQYCRTCTVEGDMHMVGTFIDRLQAITEAIEEDRALFFSNIVLGFNDALIGLTGALVAFSSTMESVRSVFVVGLITGITAALSMTASAFLQARHEQSGSPFRAGLFTGVAYLFIVLCLTAPFGIVISIQSALFFMSLVVFILLLLISFCSAVLLEKSYGKQFLEMAVLSIGVALISGIVGKLLDTLLHVPL